MNAGKDMAVKCAGNDTKEGMKITWSRTPTPEEEKSNDRQNGKYEKGSESPFKLQASMICGWKK